MPPSFPPSHCERQGLRPSAGVTRPSRPITSLCQVKRAGGGAPGATASAAPIPVLTPPQAPFTYPCLRRRRQRRRGLNRSRSPHFRGPRGPPPPAGCDPPSNVRALGAGVHATRPAARCVRQGPLSHPDTVARSPPHTLSLPPGTTPTGRPTRSLQRLVEPGPTPRRPLTRPQRGHRPLGGTQAALCECACASVCRFSGRRERVSFIKRARPWWCCSKWPKGDPKGNKWNPSTEGLPRWSELRLRNPHAGTGVIAVLSVPWPTAVAVSLELTGEQHLSSFPKSNLFPETLGYI